MVKVLINLALGYLLTVSMAFAEDRITKEQIQEVIEATDAASRNRDTQGIGKYLSRDFFKYIEVESDEMPAAVRIGKDDYLKLIDDGWQTTDEYSYRRIDLVINIAADGLSGESYSTIIETVSIEGKDMVSKVREYAHYMLEDGRAMITNIQSYTLVGDTTPG